MGLESYARLVVDNTSRRAFQAVRDQAADDVGVDTFVMSSHEASRAACAPIQGKLVTTRPESFTGANTGEHFISLYDHGYGTPSGTFGINCHHLKWLYVPGARSNNQPQYDPDEAIAKGDMVAKQRELERRVRAHKQKEALAERMNDDYGVTRNKLLIRRNQAALRKLIGDHDYLHRDYSREQKYSLPPANSKDQYAKSWHAEVQKSLGTAGVPDEATFAKVARKGGREGQLLRRYIAARRERHIEPMADFELYKELDQQIANKLHGVTAANGMSVTGHSLHVIERVIGTRYYHDQNGKVQHRDGVTIDSIKAAIEGGKIIVDAKRHSVKLVSTSCVVVLNQNGELVTVYPK